MRLFDPAVKLEFIAANKKYTIPGGADGLHFDFSVEAFAGGIAGSKPNTAIITVYGLSEATRNMFSEEHQAISFYAGYGSATGLIFAGQTTNVVHDKEPTQWRTDIYAGDGVKQFQTLFFIRSFSAGTRITQILTDLLDATTLPYTINADVSSNSETLLAGENYAAKISTCLDVLCQDRGWEWSVQHGVIEVTRKHRPLHPRTQVTATPTPAVVLSADTGLVGSPVLVDRTDDEPVDEEAESEKRKKRTPEQLANEEANRAPAVRRFAVRLTSLMNYEIRPKRIIELRAQRATSALGALMEKKTDVLRLDVSGIYIAKSVRYYGNNYGGEFYTEVEADLYD